MDKIIEDLNIKMNLIKIRKKLLSLLYIIYFSVNVGSLFILGSLPNTVIVIFLLASGCFYKMCKVDNESIKEIKKEIKERISFINKDSEENEMTKNNNKVNEEVINNYINEELSINNYEEQVKVKQKVKK